MEKAEPIELTEEMVVGNGEKGKTTKGGAFQSAIRNPIFSILSWLFPLRGIAYDTPLHRVIYLRLRKMPKERI